MKKIFVLTLMIIFSAPAFAMPGYEEGMARIGGKPRVYDVSKEQKYFEELERKYFEKYKGKDHSGVDYVNEVTIPSMDYMFKVQKERGTGYSKL